MDCTSCSERLADFLLDELPESEAVLVQEHLSLCATCMRTYKELKGTGKALEAVPSMRPVEGSPEFTQAVRSQAAVELARILDRLPPDKRLKLEARRAARMSRVVEKPAPRSRLVSLRVVAVAVAGLAALAVILAYPSHDTSPGERQPIGTLSVASGPVSQFYQRAYEPHTPVQEGKAVLPGDSFSTTDKGRARFGIGDGGSLFLGPASQVTFRLQPPGDTNIVVVLERGELGVQRPRRPAGVQDTDGTEEDPEPGWEVRSEVGTVLLGGGAHAYLKVAKSGKDFGGELSVLAGSVEVLSHAGKALGSVAANQRAVLSAEPSGRDFKCGPQEKPRVPAWRLDLVSAAELAALLDARVKTLTRRDGAVEAELAYGGPEQKPVLRVWIPETTGMSASSGRGKSGTGTGGVNVPPGTRLRHVVPFAAPLVLDLVLARESQGEVSFAFGALGSSESGVSVDVARDAAVQVREQCRTVRGASLAVRNPAGKLERLRLEIVPEKGGLVAQLSSGTAKSNPLSVPRPAGAASGKLWLQSLGDNILFDEVRIAGTIPAEWLRERLSK